MQERCKCLLLNGILFFQLGRKGIGVLFATQSDRARVDLWEGKLSAQPSCVHRVPPSELKGPWTSCPCGTYGLVPEPSTGLLLAAGLLGLGMADRKFKLRS